MKNLSIFTFCLLLFVSCAQREEGVLVLEDIPEHSGPLFVTKAVPLSSHSTPLLSNYLGAKYNKSQIWIVDKANMDAIHGFDWDGESLGSVAERGEAPSQIYNLVDFLVQEDQLVVMSNLGDEVVVYEYDFDNSVKSKAQLPFNCFAFVENSQEGYWLYSGYNRVAGEHRLRSVSKDGKLLQSELENTFHEKMIPLGEAAFFDGDGEALFKESFKPEVFVLKENGPKLKYTFDFGDLTVPAEFWEMEAIPGFEMIDGNGYANFEFLAENGDYALFDIYIQKEGISRKEIVLLDKRSKKSRKLKVDRDRDGHLLSPMGIEGDQILFIAYAPHLVANKTKLEFSDEARLKVDQVSEDDNPVIIYVEIPEI
ncbi:6-bladed beta-propeller [Algoriphagus sp. H41]|uniref:6-bladed beta-propeller n=1 Tax=Algoriphagus oliviformis TaxID=2811231 RepID=A0ABS3C8Y1_9BACT|nr:6-bladed beta-propeller [Algoriphagus oliviformis]MBN7813285.1 6-bladed beta-propeller [Algoriphagus oliviformis]